MQRVGLVVGGFIISLQVLSAPRAAGEAIGTTADLRPSVQEVQSGRPTQSDVASASFPATSSLLPLAAVASLTGLDSAGATVGGGRGAAIFNNGRPSSILTPDDVGLDLAGFAT